MENNLSRITVSGRLTKTPELMNTTDSVSTIRSWDDVRQLPAAYLPCPETKACKNVIRNIAITNPSFILAVYTKPKFADELAQSFGPAVSVMVDVDTNEKIPFEQYDIYGSKLIPDTSRSDAAKKRWDALEKPSVATTVCVSLPDELATEIKEMANRNESSVAHQVVEMLARYMDTAE